MLKKFFQMFSNDIGIDLGTANTLVYLKGHGIVINEPSVVVVNQKTGQIVAVGAEAKQMLGRTPGHVKAVKPIVDGVISDFEVAEEMITYLINKTERISKKILRPRVVIGVPTGITNVEIRAVEDAARSAGAREVYIIEEPMSAAIGIHLPVKEAMGSVIVDIGGGTTDVAVISLSGVVCSKNIKIAGDLLNGDIINYIKDEFKLLIGERTAENIKIAIASVSESQALEAEVRGRDLVTGLPRQVIVTDTDIKEAIMPSILSLVEGIKEVLETTPPELLSDIIKNGLVLSGGGAMLRGLDGFLESALKIPVYVAEDSLTAVARGAGVVLDEFETYKEVLLKTDEESISR
ncbi:MAG TPA: rod shape-determining protein [Candidatus Paceibacterota bacterium]|jgi:rod shape-determining protein MreB|nr:rod shape-determining protein [Candidatus Paceibacterota bacterium]HPC12484.1 rod shape-determining protein [Candidatus Paceibacterota bacterium]HPI66764.1 rod shape-determining protein [Candidatus Paceibacterota bacterium]HQM18509.1 rod shape-determining protein [Candidatus Paceibacterota bacterium]HQO70796.1 rod shape-determining protein [Candidatus Paceibacterota bacterium]